MGFRQGVYVFARGYSAPVLCAALISLGCRRASFPAGEAFTGPYASRANGNEASTLERDGLPRAPLLGELSSECETERLYKGRALP